MESSSIAAEQRIALNLPEGQNYSCLKCGRGCEDFDDIRVDPATIERFGRLPVSELIQDDAGEAPYRKSPWSPGEFILRKREGPREASPCCFLTEDKLCALHCAHGAESKPLACRKFPFGFTETPDGVFVGISCACTAVLENHGEALTDQAADIPKIVMKAGAQLVRKRSWRRAYICWVAMRSTLLNLGSRTGIKYESMFRSGSARMMPVASATRPSDATSRPYSTHMARRAANARRPTIRINTLSKPRQNPFEKFKTLLKN